ncbi:hypothetical protein Bhyg_09759 [Pseudolycoriella hygida]|uniref:Uncharacterized protein n=1 Tax=Pseudolycoriella hygida TaxID=35572 RepID=A0A9Q0RYI9_9DIPT|nr:hypothetical protein Bhyg_09759 [Pseudolycoriella hygida]
MKDDLMFEYLGVDQEESVQNYFDIKLNQIKRKDESDSIFMVNGNVEQKVVLDDNWKAHVTVYRSDTVDGEYSEFLSFPPIGVCAFMKTIYKKYFYTSMKDCSNVPSPDICPLEKEKYAMQCEFDAKVFHKVARPGFYIVKANLMNDEEIKTGIVIRGSVTKK